MSTSDLNNQDTIVVKADIESLERLNTCILAKKYLQSSIQSLKMIGEKIVEIERKYGVSQKSMEKIIKKNESIKDIIPLIEWFEDRIGDVPEVEELKNLVFSTIEKDYAVHKALLGKSNGINH